MDRSGPRPAPRRAGGAFARLISSSPRDDPAARILILAAGARWQPVRIAATTRATLPRLSLARELSDQRMSLRNISAELARRGRLTANERPYVATAVQSVVVWPREQRSAKTSVMALAIKIALDGLKSYQRRAS